MAAGIGMAVEPETGMAPEPETGMAEFGERTGSPVGGT